MDARGTEGVGFVLRSEGRSFKRLDTVSRLEKLVSFYVDEHTTRLPHSAFRGQTPDEMYFGTGTHIPEELNAARKVARQSRMEVNRAKSCPTCQPLVALAS